MAGPAVPIRWSRRSRAGQKGGLPADPITLTSVLRTIASVRFAAQPRQGRERFPPSPHAASWCALSAAVDRNQTMTALRMILGDLPRLCGVPGSPLGHGCQLSPYRCVPWLGQSVCIGVHRWFHWLAWYRRWSVKQGIGTTDAHRYTPMDQATGRSLAIRRTGTYEVGGLTRIFVIRWDFPGWQYRDRPASSGSETPPPSHTTRYETLVELAGSRHCWHAPPHPAIVPP